MNQYLKKKIPNRSPGPDDFTGEFCQTFTVSPLHIWTFKLQTFKDVNACSHVKLCKLVHASSIHCHMHALSTSGCVFVYKVELGLQEDGFIELCNTRSLLMKSWWNWRPRERMKRAKWRRSNWRTVEIHSVGNGKEIFFIWERSVSSWGIESKCRTVHKCCNSCSERNPELSRHRALSCHLWWG